MGACAPCGPIVDPSLAIREGLWFTSHNGFQVPVIESDCLLAVQAINSNSPTSSLDSVLVDIKAALVELGDGTCCHIPRQRNTAAHTLARESLVIGSDMCWIDTCPDCIQLCISTDATAY